MTWRCFHCDYVAHTVEEGRNHFGWNEHATPACQIDAAAYREMEETVRRYREEDTDLHRAVWVEQSNADTRARRAEEDGYAKGLAENFAYSEGKFHREIARHLTKRQQGYVMGAYRKAHERDAKPTALTVPLDITESGTLCHVLMQKFLDSGGPDKQPPWALALYTKLANANDKLMGK